jgi:hypothetical protein
MLGSGDLAPAVKLLKGLLFGLGFVALRHETWMEVRSLAVRSVWVASQERCKRALRHEAWGGALLRVT